MGIPRQSDFSNGGYHFGKKICCCTLRNHVIIIKIKTTFGLMDIVVVCREIIANKNVFRWVISFSRTRAIIFSYRNLKNKLSETGRY